VIVTELGIKKSAKNLALEKSVLSEGVDKLKDELAS
jgi:hypothetical protein